MYTWTNGLALGKGCRRTLVMSWRGHLIIIMSAGIAKLMTGGLSGQIVGEGELMILSPIGNHYPHRQNNRLMIGIGCNA